jgi:hypothetical protein
VGAAQLGAETRHTKICGRTLSLGAIAEVEAMVNSHAIEMEEYLRRPARALIFDGILIDDRLDKIGLAAVALSELFVSRSLRRSENVVASDFSN